jgi:hypothetical protein
LDQLILVISLDQANVILTVWGLQSYSRNAVNSNTDVPVVVVSSTTAVILLVMQSSHDPDDVVRIILRGCCKILLKLCSTIRLDLV